jgi:diguanylate cyclase (GGDEF)-like protein/PAS domain S-box-containing protein
MKAVSKVETLLPPAASGRRVDDLVALAGDIYWQQDDAYRFTALTGGAAGLEADRILGKTLWDCGALPVQDSAGGWAAHRAALEARAPFSGLLFKRTDASGELRYFQASGQPLFDGAGRFSGYRGVARDITRSVHAEQRLAVEHAVTRILEQSRSIDEAAPHILRALCETLGSDGGVRWQLDRPGDALHCVQTWGMPPPPADPGLARRACADAQPGWSRAAGKAPGSALAFPIRQGGRAIGAIELFSREAHRPAAEIIDCLAHVGELIGRFIARTEAAEEERRFRTAIDVSADLVMLVDPVTLRYVDANETACKVLGYTREELLGIGPLEVFSLSRRELLALYERLIAGDPGASVVDGWYRRKDGSRLAIESFRRALPSANGHVIVAVARDITERKRAEQLVKLEHAVTLALAGVDTVSAGLEAVIRCFCESEGWAGGRYWRLDEDAGVLRFGAGWGPAGSAIERHNAASREVVYRPGAGYVGRVWQSGEPLWIADVEKDGRSQRTDIASELRNRSIFLFPVALLGKTIGVVAFNSFEVREPDQRMLQAVRVLGSQIGQFVQRKQAEEGVRESEERFRSLTELSSDFYWETDREHRLVQTQFASVHRPIVPSGQRLGHTRWELPSTRPDAAGWAAHRACMERHEPFRDFEFARIDEHGAERHVSISGEPMFDAAGGFSGYRGVGKDITARKRDQLLVELEHTVTRCLAEAGDGPQALKSIMRAVCEANGWECGRYFRKGDDGVFRYAECWHRPSPEIERFIAYSRERSFAPGVGIVGRAGTGEPQWVADIAGDARVVYPMLASEHSMRGAFMFPVMAQGAALGVLSFTSLEIREPDGRLLEAVRVIGSQIGQFLQRKQAEQEMRASEERFRALTELSSDFYWETDAEHRLVPKSYGSSEHSPAIIPSVRRSGKARWDLPSTHPDAAGWAAHRAVMQAHQPFRDFEFARIGDDGIERHLSVSGEPVFDAAGIFKGYRGVGKEITARKRAEQLMKLEHTVTRSLAEADTVLGALRAAMQAVCETEGWECGRYLCVDEQAGVLRVAEVWGIGTEAIQRFLESSRGVTYAPGAGLAGRVWQSAQPLWLADIGQDSRAAQSSLIKELGLHGAVFFPLMLKDKMIGMLAFNSRKVREPEERLLQTMRVIGSQIGQFLQRKQAEEVMRESEERFRSLTLLSSDMYWEQDEQFRFIEFSGTGSPRINQASLPYLGKRRWEQNYVNMTAEDWEEHIELLEAHRPFRDLELCRVDESGRKLWVSISGEPVFDAAGRFKGYRGVGKDITARKVDEEYIQYLASHDALTALPNRTMFSEIVNHAIHSARRYGRGFALLFVDLDRFKVINDTLGHEAGDRLLKEMAQRLAHTVRSSDVVARLGGDEFVVLLHEVSDADQVETVARKVLAALMRPMSIEEHEYRVTASLGISMYPGDGDDEQALMKNADIAMYAAKEDGKNTYKFYSAEANVHSFERLALESGMRRGLDENQFLLHYQPKVDVRSCRITGVEALVRWQHPDLGLVPPGQFIPLAEESGLIVPLGKWVLRTACAQNIAWQRAGLPALCMSVNISARQFADEALLADIAAALAESGMKPELLELELTESMVMRNPERARTVLQAVKRTGVRLAIDDFGVGYSSLAHLKRFPIDTLKVDRSFIRDIPQDPEDKAIAEAIIAMGRTLNLTVVAEGVETAEQQAFLREHGCNEMQGYFFSKPLAAEQFAQLLREQPTG